MLNRIFLGIAIAAGLFVAVWGVVKVKPQIETVVEQRGKEKEGREKAERERDQTKKTLKQTQDTLTQTQQRLTAANEAKDRAENQLKDQVKANDALKADVKRITEQRDAAQAELVAWNALGLQVNEIKGMIQQLKDVIAEREVVKTENKILTQDNQKLKNRIKSLLGEDYYVELPNKLRGKVLTVNPRWDFVVVDFGQKQGALEDGELLVSRNGQLIAKLRIHTVKDDTCVADVIPGWRLNDVLEGDVVSSPQLEVCVAPWLPC